MAHIKSLIPKALVSAVALAACIALPTQVISEESFIFTKARPKVQEPISYILDQVTLGKTTLGQFVDSMEHKGCYLVRDEMFSATVDSSCLKLPGNPKIHAYGCPFSGNFLEAIAIEFTEIGTNKVYNEYLKDLTKKYGAGSLSNHKLLGADQELRWMKGKTLISLLQKKGDGQSDGTLLYMTPSMFKMLLAQTIAELREQQEEEEPTIYKPPLQTI
ncbi:MAG: hypothetical protein LUC43_10080 [Burkholderiales bacterium]|nr:hypothetical protein [Burkholderiales bacterium]